MFRETTAQDRVIEKDRARALRRHWPLAVGVAAVALLLAWLLPGIVHLLGARAAVSRSRVNIATVQRGSLVRDVATDGKVVAAVSPTLYATSSGSLTLSAHAGDKVSKGQVLATLDSPELTARLAQERGALQSADLDYKRAQLDASMQLLHARDASARAQVDRDTAERELGRGRKAHELGAYSELQVLRAQDALEKADFALSESKRVLDARPEQNRFEVDSRKATLQRQQSLVSDLQRQVDALSIRSPVDGQVGHVQVADRAAVAKDTPLLTVVDLSALEVEIQVPESLARDIAINMAASVSGTGGEWGGRVSAVSPEVVNGQVTTKVRFAGSKPQGLRQNQRLSVRIVLDRRDDALTVERGSFIDQDGGAFAYVVNGDVAEKRPIRVGALGVSKVEILKGLVVGEQVVVSGTEAFNGADRVLLGN
jgi:HlyD family secretion protein